MFLAAHDSRIKGKMFKTVESVPEISNNAVFYQIFLNLEDALDWINTAGNNGVSRRITYCYADLSGMEKIKMKSCRALNAELTKRLEAFFIIFRHQFPKKLHYHFSALENDGIPEDEKHGNDDGNIVEPMSDEHINGVFDQEVDVKEDVPPKLAILRQAAEEIAETTYTDVDSSMMQLTNNLISIIWF